MLQLRLVSSEYVFLMLRRSHGWITDLQVTCLHWLEHSWQQFRCRRGSRNRQRDECVIWYTAFKASILFDFPAHCFLWNDCIRWRPFLHRFPLHFIPELLAVLSCKPQHGKSNSTWSTPAVGVKCIINYCVLSRLCSGPIWWINKTTRGGDAMWAAGYNALNSWTYAYKKCCFCLSELCRRHVCMCL